LLSSPTFTIDSDNNITAHIGALASADESQSFSTAKELAKLTAEWHASRLVDTWNNFAGSDLRVTDLSKGEHRFQCCLHPWMRMKVEVK
jgi:hypothetical protein